MLTAPNPKTNFIDFTESVEYTLYMKNGVITHVNRALWLKKVTLIGHLLFVVWLIIGNAIWTVNLLKHDECFNS